MWYWCELTISLWSSVDVSGLWPNIGNLQFITVLSACLCVSAAEWEEFCRSGPERRDMEDSLLRGVEQLAGCVCLQAAGLLQVSIAITVPLYTFWLCLWCDGRYIHLYAQLVDFSWSSPVQQ